MLFTDLRETSDFRLNLDPARTYCLCPKMRKQREIYVGWASLPTENIIEYKWWAGMPTLHLLITK